MPGEAEARSRQKTTAGHDANVAGRDQTINNYYGPASGGTGVPMVPGLLPRDVPGFTGREEELDRLTRLAGGGRVVVTAIGGTAGVGKTALAVHAAHRLLPHFPDGHLYADLRGYTEGQEPAEPGEVLDVFLRSLGVLAEDIPARTEERSGLLRQLLASRRVLIVLDNARTEAQVRPLLPGTGGSLVLVTSRSVLPGLEADERISLDVLSKDEAAAMLAELIGADRAGTDPEAVARLAGLCGRLPLALRIAGQLLATHPVWPAGRLVRMLAGEQDRLAHLGAGDLQVRAAFEASYAQLAERDARLYRLVGLHPGPNFTSAAAAALAGTEPEAARQVLDRLTQAHLITEDTPDRFRMHDLLRLFARATCQQTDSQLDRAAAEARLVSYYTAQATFLDSCFAPQLRPAAAQAAEQAGTRFPSIREALAMFEAERLNLLAALGLAAKSGSDDQVMRLSESTAGSLKVLRYLDDMLTVTETALTAARRTGDTRAEGIVLNNLAEAYRELRQFEEAITYFERSLVIFRETGDRYKEGHTLSNLGGAYQELRRFEEAITYCQRSLVIFKEIGDRHGEGRTLNNLGHSNAGMRRFEEAITCHERALAIRREIGDRYGEGATLNSLAEAYREWRRFEEAISYFERSRLIFRETGDRYEEGAVLDNLGDTYQDLRRRDRAAECWRWAAAAMHDVGDHEEAGRLEQLATNAQSRLRKRRK